MSDLQVVKCGNCNKDLTENMSIEYSQMIDKYFCSFDCATNCYFEYMDSRPIDINDVKKHFYDTGLKIIDGKFIRTNKD